jgi:MFS family permease
MTDNSAAVGQQRRNAWLPDFGTKGWGITAFGLFFFYWCFSIFDVGMNSLYTLFEEAHGWTQVQMALSVSVGGWCSLPAIAAFGALCKAKGAKLTSIVGLAGAAVAFAIIAVAPTFIVFAVGMVLFWVSAVGFGVIGVGQFGSQWFPTRKGMYMGMTTMGVTLGSITINPIILGLVPRVGLSGLFWVCSGATVVLLVCVALFAKNNPEEAGAYPDNDKSMTKEKVQAIFAQAEEYKKNSPWTLGKVLSNRNTWLLGIGLGIPMMAATGLMNNLVPILASFGHDPMWAVMLLSTCWPAGVLGNYLIGVFDEKFGTKPAIYVVLGALMVACLIVEFFATSPVLVVVGIALFMFAISGNSNICVSMTVSVFGRHDFDNAYPSVATIYRFCQVSGISLIAIIFTSYGPLATVGALIGLIVVAAILVTFISNKQITAKLEA